MRQGIKAFYDHKYETGVELVRSSKQLAVDCVPAVPRCEILDVGCGSGMNSILLARKGHRMHGVDISEVAIEQYNSHGFDGRVADIEAGLEYDDSSFDMVFCSEVIEHMTSPEALVLEIGRVLKPGGRLVLSTPNSAFWLYRALGLLGYTVGELQHPKHFQFFSRRSLLKLLESGNLRTKEIFGRNMYVILPDVSKPLRNILSWLGFQRETRFRTGKCFWHFSTGSRFMNTFFADTIIVTMEKPR
jgi:2-polyprenyl-3-methyl-5-hydroxy-6-metoxy-1,4-benzoquinol methylase